MFPFLRAFPNRILMGRVAERFGSFLPRKRRTGSPEEPNGLPDDNSELVPPESIPNSVVKRLSADGSVGVPM